MLDHLQALADNSDRFRAAIAATAGPDGALSATVSVPACPDWSAADLAWHLTEVQYVWARMVGDGLARYVDLPPLVRPDLDAALPELFGTWNQRLRTVLAEREPSQPCWSWHPTGGNVAWVRRRQAQEALIHRVDAEQTAGVSGHGAVGPIDEALAADGIDEILSVMMSADPVPTWGRFEAEDAGMRLVAGPRRWDLVLGRLVGTDDDGVDRDLESVRLIAEGDEGPEPTSTISGSAAAIDLWLWRRRSLDDGPGGAMEVVGDRELAARLQGLAAIT